MRILHERTREEENVEDESSSKGRKVGVSPKAATTGGLVAEYVVKFEKGEPRKRVPSKDM